MMKAVFLWLAIIFLMVALAFSQLTIHGQKKLLSNKQAEVNELRSTMVEVSEINWQSTVTFCETIDTLRARLGERNLHFADQARKIEKVTLPR